MAFEIPPQDTIEYFDFLLEAVVEETLLEGYFGDNKEAIAFHVGMLRTAYQRALEGRQIGKVVIEVLGGVAEVTSQPDGVEVEIIDHDNEEGELW